MKWKGRWIAMAEKLTPQQQMAVQNRGGKLLVSAAAGSGKTKVLVDRLMGYLTDPHDPANLDDFLIITYTKAAAAELRGKIAAKLTERIAADPQNRHLQRQLQRLYLAKISTVHSFCGDILREHAYIVDIPGDFRVADENECRQLRADVLSRVLDKAYQTIAEDGDLQAFVDTQGLGRDDRLLPDIILKVYDSARCHIQPELWLDACVANAGTENLKDAAQTPWGRYLLEDMKSYLRLQIQAMTACAERAEQAQDMEKPAQLLRDTVAQLQQLYDSATWDEAARRKEIDYGTLRFSKKCSDLQLVEQIKAVRDACKKGVERKCRSFSDSSEILLGDMEQILPALRGLIALVRQFGQAYDQCKRSRRIVDFGDLEHKTLDLLLGRSRSGPTAAAKQIGDRFREILVDEYQDSNAVQDAIFSALTEKRQNCFMVGDVKQSIYQFRLADPGIFLQKYAAYAPAEKALPGQGRKILLTKNFRSGGAVLAGANDVFATCMSPDVGGLHYGEEDALQEGFPHVPLGEPEVELWTVPVCEDQYLEEAELVAERIEELLGGNHFVRDGDNLRPIRPEDIAILLRSPGSTAGAFQEALARRGRRCVSGGGEDLLQAEEIIVLRALLQTVSNPRQDIPLIAALSSPVFGFTADDLAAFRSKQRRGCVYEALLQEPSEKAENFLQTLEHLRRQARLLTLTQLIQTVYLRTGLDSLYAAKENGDVRSTNLQAFYQLAVAFEANGPRDLEQFLEHLDAMEEKGLIMAGEQTAPGAVTLMSIHKSKGLEFPVVFVSGLSRVFNRESTRGQVLCDQDLGLGLTAVDRRNRVRYPTVAKRAIAAKIASDSLSEEMRVLYVALTRARDRLIMTYASDGLPKDLAQTAARMDMGDRELLTRDAVCPGDWVLMAALQRTEAGELFRLGARPEQTKLGEYPWLIRVAEAPEAEETSKRLQKARPKMPQEELEQIRKGLSFSYAHRLATQTPSKQTATQQKGRQKDEEAAEHTKRNHERVKTWRKPTFVEEDTRGTVLGTVIHRVMQYIPYENCGSVSSIRREVDALVQKGFLTMQQAQLVDCEKLNAFFRTELGEKLCAGGRVLREFKFSILDDGGDIAPELAGEQILLQGVVDCALQEADGITVLDFKTDRVTSETIGLAAERYRPQIQTYARAVERIFGVPVKKTVLYFFGLNQFVEV